MDAIILCGGKGTRLASVVSDVPKPMAPVCGRPFLDYILWNLSREGLIKRFIMATGYLGHKIRDHYGESYRGISIIYSQEESSLGTAGAIIRLSSEIKLSPLFVAVNGDSFVKINISELIREIRQDIYAVIGLYYTLDTSRYGQVEIQDGYITSFKEKANDPKAGWINTGIYLFRLESIASWKDHLKNLSLEREILPVMATNRQLASCSTALDFIDIGTPESYKEAQTFFEYRTRIS